jgi:hypothetical protein
LRDEGISSLQAQAWSKSRPTNNNKNTQAGGQHLGDVMIRKRTALVYALCATLLLSTSGVANATCGANAAGKWHFFALQGQSPSIQVTTTTVRNSAGTGTVNVRSFPLTSEPFQNDTERAIKCVLTVAATGNFSNAPCTSYGVTGGAPQNVNVSGHLTLTSPAWNLGGTITIPGDPPVVIQGGHVNGVSGSGIGTQGTKRVFHFSLVKN